jgi:hypothetical protein
MVQFWFLYNIGFKENLARRGLTFADMKVYVDGCRVVETSNHLFLGCNLSQYLWSEIRLWLGIYDLLANVVDDHVFTIL